MIKLVTITALQRRAAEVISGLGDEPVIISRHGRPAAVIVKAETYERMERALADAETRQVREIVKAGLDSYRAGRISPHADAVRRVQAARRKD